MKDETLSSRKITCSKQDYKFGLVYNVTFYEKKLNPKISKMGKKLNKKHTLYKTSISIGVYSSVVCS